MDLYRAMSCYWLDDTNHPSGSYLLTPDDEHSSPETKVELPLLEAEDGNPSTKSDEKSPSSRADDSDPKEKM
jgi:hypothetical protein